MIFIRITRKFASRGEESVTKSQPFTRRRTQKVSLGNVTTLKVALKIDKRIRNVTSVRRFLYSFTDDKISRRFKREEIDDCESQTEDDARDFARDARGNSRPRVDLTFSRRRRRRRFVKRGVNGGGDKRTPRKSRVRNPRLEVWRTYSLVKWRKATVKYHREGAGKPSFASSLP